MHRSTEVAAVPVLATAVVAACGAAVAAIWYHVAQGVTVSLGVGLALLPVWWTALRRYRGALPLVLLGLLVLAFGFLLGAFEVSRGVSLPLMREHLLDFATFLTSLGVLLWCREQMGSGVTVLCFGVGSLLSSTLIGLDDSNPWKFSLAIPVALVAFGAVMIMRSRVGEVVVLIGLAVTSLLSDSRSMTAFFILVVPVVVWQMAKRASSRKAHPVQILIWLGALGYGVYNLFLSLILDGAFGDAARERTQAQIDTSGSLLLGGRPEVGASLALITNKPLGYGAGVLPKSSDVWVAKAGMGALGYDPNNGYVEKYMFGSQFEVHSVLGDFWIRLGFPAAVFLLLLVGLALNGVVKELSMRRASAVVVYLLLLGLWNLLFSPALPSYPFLALLFSLAVLRRDPLLSQVRHGGALDGGASAGRGALSSKEI